MVRKYQTHNFCLLLLFMIKVCLPSKLLKWNSRLIPLLSHVQITAEPSNEGHSMVNADRKNNLIKSKLFKLGWNL